jgi:septal ring factor EnvC (AmiA/AmiB activator)
MDIFAFIQVEIPSLSSPSEIDLPDAPSTSENPSFTHPLDLASTSASIPDEKAELQQQIVNLQEQLKRKETTEKQLDQVISQLKRTSKNLKAQLTRAQKRVSSKEEEIVRLLMKLTDSWHSHLEKLLQELPEAPRCVLMVMLNGGKKIKWGKHPKVLELCIPDPPRCVQLHTAT